MKRCTIADLCPNESRFMPETLGGVYVFKPGETAHPERHVHDVDEVFFSSA